MFHVYTATGVQYNVPMEKLQKPQKVSPYRKIIGFKNNSGNTDFSSAEKAYRDAVHVENEREEIFYAYEIMSSPVYTLQQGLNIAVAWNDFEAKKVHHMPVLSDSKEIIGIVSYGDLLKRMNVINNVIEKITDITVKDIMTREVISAGRVTDIRRIAKVMFDNHIGTMPILDENALLTGIITRSDILFALINRAPLKLWT